MYRRVVESGKKGEGKRRLNGCLGEKGGERVDEGS